MDTNYRAKDLHYDAKHLDLGRLTFQFELISYEYQILPNPFPNISELWLHPESEHRKEYCSNVAWHTQTKPKNQSLNPGHARLNGQDLIVYSSIKDEQ